MSSSEIVITDLTCPSNLTGMVRNRLHSFRKPFQPKRLCEIELIPLTYTLCALGQTTAGDNNQSQPLYLLGGKGVQERSGHRSLSVGAPS